MLFAHGHPMIPRYMALSLGVISEEGKPPVQLLCYGDDAHAVIVLEPWNLPRPKVGDTTAAYAWASERFRVHLMICRGERNYRLYTAEDQERCMTSMTEVVAAHPHGEHALKLFFAIVRMHWPEVNEAVEQEERKGQKYGVNVVPFPSNIEGEA